MATKKEFTFWLDNKVDAEFKMSAEDFKKKFLEWIKTKEISWLKYYGTTPALHEFIGRELKSVSDDKEESGLYDLVRDDFWNYVEPKKQTS